MKLSNALIMITTFFTFACSSVPKNEEAIAVIKGPDGRDFGNVSFKQEGDYTVIIANLRNLSANSSHGFHIHEFGNCNGDFSAVGEHFNPDHHPHGGMNSAAHAGDLGNVQTNSNGEVNVRLATRKFRIDEGTPNVLGRSVIIHAKKDDLKTSPTGNSGDKLGCGMIESI